MYVKNYEEGFQLVKTENDAWDIVGRDGMNCLLYKAWGKGNEVSYIISRENLAQAVALTPAGYHVTISEPKSCNVLLTTIGNLLDRVYFLKGAEFIAFQKSVIEYQQSEKVAPISCVEMGSEFDVLRPFCEMWYQEEMNKSLGRMVLSLKTPYHTYDKVGVEVQQYAANKSLCVVLTTFDEEDGFVENLEYITTCLPNAVYPATGMRAYVNTNCHIPGLEKWLVDNGLAKPVDGVMATSGYCTYPMYEFSLEKLKELCPEDISDYLSNSAVEVL